MDEGQGYSIIVLSTKGSRFSYRGCWGQLSLLLVSFPFIFLYYGIIPYGVKCIHDLVVEFVRNSILYNLVLCYILNVVFLLLQVFYESL